MADEGINVDLGLGHGARWRVSLPAMGTRFDIHGEGGDLRALTEAVSSQLGEDESRWSVFRPSSLISQLNASEEWVDVDPSTDRLLADARSLAEATAGAFTPLIGRLVELWDNKARRRALLSSQTLPSPPSAQDRARARALCSTRFLERQRAGRWRLASDMCAQRPHIDLGGIAKGASADALADTVMAHGATSVLVSAGTSSLSCRGVRSDGKAWRVGLRTPGGPESQWVGRVEMAAGALSSSSHLSPGVVSPHLQGAGTVWRADDLASVSSHVLDPRTGAPSNSGISQVSVLCESGVMAEALSTAILVAGKDTVDQVRLQEWANRRGVNPQWEAVIFGVDGVEASIGARWMPRADQA